MVKTWEISVKGYNAQVYQDPTLKKRYQDVAYGYGKILFKGTEGECDAFEMKLFRKGFKILGTSEFDLSTEDLDKKKKVFSLWLRAEKKFQDLVNHTDKYDKRIFRTANGSRDWTEAELKLQAVSKRIWSYYIKKYT